MGNPGSLSLSVSPDSPGNPAPASLQMYLSLRRSADVRLNSSHNPLRFGGHSVAV